VKFKAKPAQSAGAAWKEPSAGANGDARPSEIQVGVPDRERAALAPLVAPYLAFAGPLLRLERVEAGYGQARVLMGVDLAVEASQKRTKQARVKTRVSFYTALYGDIRVKLYCM
jgi:hypothetical protein